MKTARCIYALTYFSQKWKDTLRHLCTTAKEKDKKLDL